MTPTQTPTEAFTINEMMIQSAAIQRHAAHAAEVALKGFYTDWLFSKLNITKYR